MNKDYQMNIMKLGRAVALGLAVAAASMLAGCETTPAFQVSQPSARVGTVESIRSETVQNSNQALGTIGGALVGGILGNQVGGGSGRTVATVVGAAGGAYAGNRMTSGTSLVWVIGIRHDDGTFSTVRQTSGPGVRIGDRVRVGNSGMEILR
jgi:outer membrane lipoprotein SlyB